MTNNKKIAGWAGWKPQWNQLNPPPYDADIALWYGKEGLLAKIGEQGLIVNWIKQLDWEIDPVCTDRGGIYAQWILVNATSAEFAEALVKTIKEESKGEEK